MTPAAAISMLDRSLAKNGEDVTLRRIVGTGSGAIDYDLSVRAHVRSLKEDELVSGVSQDDRMVIMSPSEITEANWPDGVLSLPQYLDHVILEGPQKTTVQFVNPIRMAGQVVRIEMRIKG